MEQILNISNLKFNYGIQTILDDFSWEISKGENWIISGPSGTGKTTLAQIISGEIKNFEGLVEFNFEENSKLKPKVIYVPNWYQFANLEGERNFYYQQRYNQSSQKETLTVFDELNKFGNQENLSFEDVEEILDLLELNHCRERQLIELSSGEHKKLQLTKAIWQKPQLLIIDQPYAGLDTKSRQNLNLIFEQLNQEKITLILIDNDDEHPDGFQNFAEIKDGKFVKIQDRNLITKQNPRIPKSIPHFLQQKPASSASVVKMEKVNIYYGKKQVLKEVDWEIKHGEKWLLKGHNGSGKSTLLSLLNGDHPQAYANDIYLFGNKRGSGESIWEIKEKIGIISPELHWYYDFNANVGQTIASGFFDSMSLYQNLNFEQKHKLEQILYFFDLKDVKNKKLNTLSLGMQRLSLLARTIVKNPELLILDEPCQGLDREQTAYFNQVIDDLCQHGQTLIYVGHIESQLPKNFTHQLILEKGKVVPS